MHGYGLVSTILLSRDGAGLMAWFVLLAFCGLLRPPQRTARVEAQKRALREDAAAPTVKLHAIELSLLAELSLEQARAHEEVAKDEAARPDTRRKSEATAMDWRERARVFQACARRQAAAPFVPAAQAYAGPERRRTRRRRDMRRVVPRASVSREADDRRTVIDRRLADRRHPELARR
jgi:hypothetical protein